MRKIIFLVFVGAILVTGCGNGNKEETATTQSDSITINEAKTIAMKDAGINEEDISYFKEVAMDLDDGQKVYDIEFVVETSEYDYEISASDGSIRSKDNEIENYNVTKQTDTTTDSSTTSGDTTPSEELISESEAKSIALNHVNLQESEVNFEKTELETENGIRVYDVEFNLGRSEHKFEINATSGIIIQYDYDYDD